MKKLFLFFIFLGLLVPHVSFARVIFSEIAWMGTPASQFGEWVEFFNDGDAEVDLEGAILFEGGGATLIFTLTKKIPAKGYYVLERTTASSLDPLSGIEDDAGSFGGGGLSNSGEFLVLKGKDGAELDRLDGTAGWPAGDASTKATMQWNGTSWITASATPRSATIPSTAAPSASPASSSSASSGSESSSAPSSHAGTAPIAGVIKLREPLLVQAGRDRLGFVGVPLVFQGKGFLGDAASVVKDPAFAWSFGDGGFATGMAVEHAFQFPGDYVVVLNGTRGEEESIARIKVKIVAPDLAITKVEQGARPFIEITNRSSGEVNLWGASIRAGHFVFQFPHDTILAPNASVAFPKEITGLVPKDGDEVALLWPGGRVGSVVTLRAHEEDTALAEAQKTIESLKVQIEGIAPKPAPSPVAPRKVALVESVTEGIPATPAPTAPRIIEIPKSGASATGVFSWPRRALAFIGGLIFSSEK